MSVSKPHPPCSPSPIEQNKSLANATAVDGSSDWRRRLLLYDAPVQKIFSHTKSDESPIKKAAEIASAETDIAYAALVGAAPPSVAASIAPTGSAHKRHFHGTQQDPLNAELRSAVHDVQLQWHKEGILGTGRFILETSRKAPMVHTKVNASVSSYKSGYRCTEDLTVSPQQLIAELGLSVSLSRLKEMEEAPTLDVTAVESTFSQLQNAPSLLPLDVLGIAREKLSVLDTYAKCPMADCSIALHDRHHVDVTEALRVELSAGASYLQALENRITDTRARRKVAQSSSTSSDIARAVECFQEEVTVGSDLVRLNQARMSLFDDAEKDALSYRKDVEDLIAATMEMTLTLPAQRDKFNEGIEDDIKRILDAIKAKSNDREITGKNADNFYKEQRDIISELDHEEEVLWREINDKLRRLSELSAKRNDTTAKLLNAIEVAQKKDLEFECYLNALGELLKRLRNVQSLPTSMGRVADLFESYARAMATKLAEDMYETDMAIRELKISEAALVISRYDTFADAAEESHQRTKNRIEGLLREVRQHSLSSEVVASTLDPRTPEYESATVRAQLQISALNEYLQQLEKVQAERKADVDPTIDFALSVLATDNECGGDPDAYGGDPMLHADVKLLEEAASVPRQRLAKAALSGAPAASVGRKRNLLSKPSTPGLLESAKAEASKTPPAKEIESHETTPEGQKIAQISTASLEARPAQLYAVGRFRHVDLSRHPQLAAALRSLSEENYEIGKATGYVQGEQDAVDYQLQRIREINNIAKRTGVRAALAAYEKMPPGGSKKTIQEATKDPQDI